MDLADATPFLAANHRAVLITTKNDGRPQSSNIAYHFDAAGPDGSSSRISISVTDDRAKTRNLRKRPQAVLHVLNDNWGQYLAIECDVAFSDVTTEPGDESGQELLSVYEAIVGSAHPDPQEFFEAMVAEQRLVLRLTPTHVYGQI